ncbi:pollen receptor-like kinase 4 [Ananas comosus]|uniref:non-specific serine/threonine protein kinase n=1 Tax=Ananas comosus TaxID=4615 RepID=A0A6P5GW52_ANACO|nr:pollen receptor-like kinase 4 [Ananas comosus]
MAVPAAPWLLLPFLLLAPSLAAAAVSEADALIAFKSTLSGAGAGASAALANWVPGTSPCSGNRTLWRGVLCDEGGRVLGLQLENMSLSGALTLDPLVDLPALRTLSFKNNSFAGPIPDLAKLGALKMIYLSRNRFSGPIADELFDKMRSLRKVHLSHNAFSGPIPSSVAGLSELGLDDNAFEGAIPDLEQKGLTFVNLSHNQLEGPIPKGLSRFNASMFEGNKNLCGRPLDVSCDITQSQSPRSPAKKKISPTLLVVIIVIGVLALLSIVGLFVFILSSRRRRQLDEANLVHLQSAETKKFDAPEANKVDRGAAEYRGGAAKKAHKEDHGKLSFVREGSQSFGIEDLLRASAEVLGSGNFGSSYKATLFDGPSVVVKRFREMNGVGREDFQEHMRRLGRLSHPNLLPLVAYLYRKEEKLLITDYIPNGSLAHMLHGNRGSNLPPLDWPARLKVIKGVARGLAYLYEELPMLTVPHGHLKSSNVLLDDSFEPILTDYALLPVMNRSHASQVMVAFKSPECAQHGKPSKKSDIWSFGILILEILTGKFPANYLRQGNAGTDLASWVNSVVREEWTGEVFDTAMKGTKNGEGEMLKLLQIGLGCCEADVERRWELGVVLNKIEELRERESDGENSSFDGEGGYSSKGMTEDDFSFSTNN